MLAITKEEDKEGNGDDEEEESIIDIGDQTFEGRPLSDEKSQS